MHHLSYRRERIVNAVVTIAVCVFFSDALLTSTLLLVNIHPSAAFDTNRGVFYTMQHRTVSLPSLDCVL